jgi:hypothetical protein
VGFDMKKLNELIIFFLDICYSLKNVHFLKMNEESQNEQLLDHIKAVRTVIDMYLNNLEKELSNIKD